MNINATLAAIRAMTRKWPQAVAKFVEDKANGPAVITLLSGQVPGLIPVEPRGSKYSRAAAVSPFVHAHNVHLPTPEILPNVAELLEEARGFPNASHDDTIDALSQALDQLLLLPILDEDDQVTSDELLEDDPHGYLATY
jgi:predicted phage terminase large subunit-like protein